MNFLAGDEKRFFEFMANLNEKDKVALLSHNDMDGVASAAIISKVVGNIDHIGFLSYHPNMLEEIASELKKRKINKIIVSDLGIDQELDNLKMFEQFADILVIDHHPIKHDLNTEKTVFIKAETNYPASYMCYYLFSKIQQIPSWISALGILADCPHMYGEKNAERVFSDYSLRKGENLYSTLRIVNFSLAYFKGKENQVYDVLMKAKSYSDLRELEKYSKIAVGEFEKCRGDFENDKEEYGDLIYCYFKMKYAVKDMVINALSIEAERRSKTFVFAVKYEDDKMINISARRQDKKINCADLMRKSVFGIPDSTAGGHVASSGGKIPEEFLNKFKENLIREHKKLSDRKI